MSDESWKKLIEDGVAAAHKAMEKYPAPNYTISKFAEEAGEVVKAAIHCAEDRETPENLRGEMVQTIAMMYRLWVEGDEVHGLKPVRPIDTHKIVWVSGTPPPGRLIGSFMGVPVEVFGAKNSADTYPEWFVLLNGKTKIDLPKSIRLRQEAQKWIEERLTSAQDLVDLLGYAMRNDQ